MRLRNEDRLQRFRAHQRIEPDRSLFLNQRTSVRCLCERCNGTNVLTRVLDRARSILTKRRHVVTDESREGESRVSGWDERPSQP